MDTITTPPQEGTFASVRDTGVTLVVEHSAECLAVNDVLGRIGDKWSVRVFMSLSGGPRRFNQLRREIPGISQRMLTRTLRGLERDGLIRRTVTPSIPPRVDYDLTELGGSLREPVARLGTWAIANIGAIAAARALYDAAQPDQTKL